VVHEAVIIQYPCFLELRDEFAGGGPGRGGVAEGFHAVAEGGEDGNRFVEDGFLLLSGHLAWKFMGVAVETDFVASVPDLCELGGEGFEGVGWGEEGCFDGVTGEEGEEAVEADGGAVDAAGDVGGLVDVGTYQGMSREVAYVMCS